MNKQKFKIGEEVHIKSLNVVAKINDYNDLDGDYWINTDVNGNYVWNWVAEDDLESSDKDKTTNKYKPLTKQDLIKLIRLGQQDGASVGAATEVNSQIRAEGILKTFLDGREK